MPHLSDSELVEIITAAKEQVHVGDRYFHHRSPDHIYTVIAVALDEESHQPVIVYQSSKNTELIWVRTLPEWLATVTEDDGQTVARFTRVTE